MNNYRQMFADFLQRLINTENEVDREDWSDHIITHYFDNGLEDTRVEVVRLLRGKSQITPEARLKLIEWRLQLLNGDNE